MNFFKYIFSLVRLEKTIRYHDSYDSLIHLMSLLNQGKLDKLGIRCTEVSKNRYTLEPEENTPMEMSGPFFYFTQDATVYVTVKQKSGKLQLIECKGKIRSIHYGFICFYIFFLSTQVFFTEKSISTTAIIIWTFVWIASHLLLNFYWSQKEKYVIEQFKKALLILMKIHR